MQDSAAEATVESSGVKDCGKSTAGSNVLCKNIVVNSGTYSGQMRGGLMHGRGVWTGTGVVSGQRYEGEYVAGRAHGSGIYTWPTGRMYVGEFRTEIQTNFYHRREGRGALWSDNGDQCFEGDWRSGRPLGGTLVCADGSVHRATYDGTVVLNDDSFTACSRALVGRIEVWPPPAAARRGVWRATVTRADGTRFEGEMCGLCPLRGWEALPAGRRTRVFYAGDRTLAEAPSPAASEVRRPSRRASDRFRSAPRYALSLPVPPTTRSLWPTLVWGRGVHQVCGGTLVPGCCVTGRPAGGRSRSRTSCAGWACRRRRRRRPWARCARRSSRRCSSEPSSPRRQRRLRLHTLGIAVGGIVPQPVHPFIPCPTVMNRLSASPSHSPSLPPSLPLSLSLYIYVFIYMYINTYINY